MRPFLTLAIGVLVVAGCSTPTHSPGDAQDTAELEARLTAAFDVETCIGPDQAMAAIKSVLDSGGLGRWAIEYEPGGQTARCVGFSLRAAERSIALGQTLHPVVRSALDELRAELERRCLSEEEARLLLKEVLHDSGEVAFEVRADGPVGAPKDRLPDVLRHVEAGCFVYSGTGWTAEGVRVFYLAGLPD